MAKAKKTARKRKKRLRGSLPPGQGKKMMEAFYNRMSTVSGAPEFPQAVVHTIDDLRAFLDSAEKTINPNPKDPVPADQRGIAIIPGYTKNEVTYMLVATRFTEDILTNKITVINNPVTGIHVKPVKPARKAKAKAAPKGSAPVTGTDPTTPPVGDNSLDAGSTFP